MMFDLGNGFCYDSDRLLLIPSNSSINLPEPKQQEPWTAKQVPFRSEPPSISGIGLCLNDNCNLRCKYCSECSTEGRKRLDMDKILVFLDEALVKHLLEHDTLMPLPIGITGGGEPTYDMNFFRKVIREIKSQCLKTKIKPSFSLTTNGTLTDLDDISFIAENIDNVLISYDGLPELQDKQRPFSDGSGSSDIVRNFIRNMIKFGCKPSIRTIVRPSDFCFLPKMLDELKELTNFEIKDWSLYPEMPIGRAKGCYNDEDALSNPFYPTFKRLLDYSLEKYGFDRISSPIFSFRPIHCYCGGLVSDKTGMWLLSSGKVYCCIDYRKKPIAIVSKHKLAYDESFTDDLMIEYSHQYNSRRCTSCISYRVCRGGCPAKSLNLPQNYQKWECQAECDAWMDVLRDLCKGHPSHGWTIDDSGAILEMVYNNPEKEHHPEDKRRFKPSVYRSVLSLPDSKMVLNESATVIYEYIMKNGLDNIRDIDLFNEIQSHFSDDHLEFDSVMRDAYNIIDYFKKINALL